MNCRVASQEVGVPTGQRIGRQGEPAAAAAPAGTSALRCITPQGTAIHVHGIKGDPNALFDSFKSRPKQARPHENAANTSTCVTLLTGEGGYRVRFVTRHAERQHHHHDL